MVLLFARFKCDKIIIRKSTKVGDMMATASFNKDITIKEPEAIKKFINIISKDTSPMYIDKDKTSEKTMARGEQLLKQYLSR
jgi:hypothetical protein